MHQNLKAKLSAQKLSVGNKTKKNKSKTKNKNKKQKKLCTEGQIIDHRDLHEVQPQTVQKLPTINSEKKTC